MTYLIVFAGVLFIVISLYLSFNNNEEEDYYVEPAVTKVPEPEVAPVEEPVKLTKKAVKKTPAKKAAKKAVKKVKTV